MPPTYDMSSPKTRREALRSVDINAPAGSHLLIRDCLRAEMDWARSPSMPEEAESDEYENQVLCSFMLHLIGDFDDVLPLYRAKFESGDMDIAISLDVECMFGSGVDPTLIWLSSNGHRRERRILEKWVAESAAHWNLVRWAEGKRQYFYEDGHTLLLDPL